eukprot:jgi/Chlat1/2542/Chrsp175S02395
MGARVVATLPASIFAWLHAGVVYASFAAALVITCSLHFLKVVKNEHFGWPVEWFPSISATIGDWLLLSALFFVLIKGDSERRGKRLMAYNAAVTLLTVLRTLAAGGWIFFTSCDDHFVHDVTMVSYLVLSLLSYIFVPWLMYAARSPLTPQDRRLVRNKLLVLLAFLVNLVPLVYYFLQHKLHAVPGAYTLYAFAEWALVVIDVGFDATMIADFATLRIVVEDTTAEKRLNAGNGDASHSPSQPAVGGKGDNIPTSSSSFILSTLGLASDVYLGFVSWTLNTALYVCIWYFPLFNMGLSGYEVAILAMSTAPLLVIKRLRSSISSIKWLLHFLSLSGLAAYLVPDPARRLGITGIGVAFDTLAVTGAFYLKDEAKDRAIVGHLLGLILSLVVRFAHVTNNPAWPIMRANNGGQNAVYLAGACIACLAMLVRTLNTRKPPSDPTPSKPVTNGTFFSAGLGFGSVVFVTQFIFSEASVVSRWVVAGHPDRGPDPYPWGVVVISALALGVAASDQMWVTTSLWWAVAAVGATLLYTAPTYYGFAGGVILAVYVGSVWPAIINRISANPPGRTLLVGLLLFYLLTFGYVWTVAYAFVPLGVYMRERISLVLAGAMLGLYFGAVGSTPLFGGLTQEKKRREKLRLRLGTLFVLVLMLGAAATRRPVPADYQPVKSKEPGVFTAGIWAVHFGYDSDMWASHQRMVDVIQELDMDIIGLLESDSMRMWMGNRDFVQWMGEHLRMHVDYGPATRNHTWGCALLSKYPILWSEHHSLPSPVGEIACAIHATLDVYGRKLDVVVAHNGQEEDVLDRELQTKELARILRTAKNPVVFIGYVVTKPHEGNYHVLINGTEGVKDIDPTDSDRWCEYIAYKGLQRVGYARVSHGGITDTELQVARFRMVSTQTADFHEEVAEAAVSLHLRFPRQFYGQGTRGHRYHVFDRPKYFGKQL